MNCLSTAEAAVTGAAFVGYAVKPRLHRLLAKLDVVNEPDPVAHDVTTVAFLRSLDLDPVEILGADVVAAATALGSRSVERRTRRARPSLRLGATHRLPELADHPVGRPEQRQRHGGDDPRVDVGQRTRPDPVGARP